MHSSKHRNQYRGQRWSRLHSLEMPPYRGILHSEIAGLMSVCYHSRRRCSLGPNCRQLSRSWPVGQLGLIHRSICLRGQNHRNQVKGILLQCLAKPCLILRTLYLLFVILTHSTMADFLQQENTAVTRAVGLKPQMITLITRFRMEPATVASDSAQSNVHSCVELAMVVLTLSGVRMRIVPHN